MGSFPLFMVDRPLVADEVVYHGRHVIGEVVDDQDADLYQSGHLSLPRQKTVGERHGRGGFDVF